MSVSPSLPLPSEALKYSSTIPGVGRDLPIEWRFFEAFESVGKRLHVGDLTSHENCKVSLVHGSSVSSINRS